MLSEQCFLSTNKGRKKIFLARILRITVASYDITRAIQYLTVSNEGLSMGIEAIRAVDQRVDVVLTRYLTG